MEEKSFQKQSLSVDAPLCREEKAVEDEETEVQQRPLEGQGESRRRSSARRESAKKKRCNNRRHITTTLTTLVDSLVRNPLVLLPHVHNSQLCLASLDLRRHVEA